MGHSVGSVDHEDDDRWTVEAVPYQVSDAKEGLSGIG